MKKKFWKTIGKIGNILTVLTILSTLSKIESVNDLLVFLENLGEMMERIIKLFGRLANLIITPWDFIVNKFFSLIPWKIPEGWQNYVILCTLSIKYPMLLFGKRVIKFSNSIRQKKLNSLMEYYSNIGEGELDSNYKTSKKIISSLLKDYNLFIIGPISEYLIIVRSDIPLKTKKIYYASVEKHITGVDNMFKHHVKFKKRLHKISKTLFYISLTILSLFVLDKFRNGFSLDFLVYGLKGIVIIIISIIISILLAILLTLFFVFLVFLFQFLFLKVSKKKAMKKISDRIKSHWNSFNDDRENMPENMGISADGKSINDLESYLKLLDNDEFKYEKMDLSPYNWKDENLV
ncbi:MAG: hypothetical protein AAF611_01595 [Bacteroidota bacterium]